MKCLVTGGAGFIGSHCTDRLIELGYDVVVVDNECAPENDNFYWRDDTENHKVNIMDYDQLAPLFKGVDYVFHFAAESRIQPSIIDPRYAINVNVSGTANVCQAAREGGVKRLMYSGTSASYGLASTPPLKEDMPTDCLNPYSVGKVGGEEVCKMYTRLFGLETVRFRYFNVYGDRSPTKGQYAPVIGLFFQQKTKKEPMTIVGDGSRRRDYTHVSDIVEANILAATCQEDDTVGQLFNLGNGVNYSVNDLVKMIGGSFIHIDDRPGEAEHTLADNTRATTILKWEPKVYLPEWILHNKPE
jgi:UDP-glucose 4-epimerase